MIAANALKAIKPGKISNEKEPRFQKVAAGQQPHTNSQNSFWNVKTLKKVQSIFIFIGEYRFF